MNKRKVDHVEAEIIYEQWAKYLCINIIDQDILNDFNSHSKTIENITLEKIRCIFSEAYRFALLQVHQRSKRALHDADSRQLSLENFIEEQDEFINEKINDSFLLHRLEKRFAMSRKLAEDFEEHKNRDCLKW